jgi:hypothetical protein
MNNYKFRSAAMFLFHILQSIQSLLAVSCFSKIKMLFIVESVLLPPRKFAQPLRSGQSETTKLRGHEWHSNRQRKAAEIVLDEQTHNGMITNHRRTSRF